MQGKKSQFLTSFITTKVRASLQTQMKRKVVIIGASIAGFYVMDELVKKNFDGDITIIDKKDVYPYNTYPLSKEWMLDLADMEPPLLKKREFYSENNIDLRLSTKVVSINSVEQTITTHLNETITYDYLC